MNNNRSNELERVETDGPSGINGRGMVGEDENGMERIRGNSNLPGAIVEDGDESTLVQTQ